MATRNNTLGNVRSILKAELGKSLQTTSTAEDIYLNQVIENVQYELCAMRAWPFLKSRWDASIPAGTRFTAFPTTLSPQGGAPGATATINFEHSTTCQVKWNNVWQPVIYGIDEYPEFNYLDSDRNQVLDPVQRWQFSDEGQFEVWPLPASQAQVRFVGQRQPVTLQTGSTTPPTWNDAALVNMDDLLVVYYACSQYNMWQGKEDLAKLARDKFQRRYLALCGAYPTRTQTITIGRGLPFDRKAIRNVPLVLVGGK